MSVYLGDKEVGVTVIPSNYPDVSDTTATAEGVAKDLVFYNKDGERTIGKLAVSPYGDRLQWKCDNMKSLYYEFYNYKGTDLSILNGLDTKNVTDMSTMFRGCTNITEVPFLDTSNVTDMTSFVQGCSSLTKFPLIDTSKTRIFGSMFRDCVKLTEVPLLNMSSGYNCSNMFNGCSTLVVVPNLDVSNFVVVGGMFLGCKVLEEVPPLNTINATNVGALFSGCTALVTVPKVDMISVTSSSSASNLFYNCKNITNITVCNIKVGLIIGSGTSYGTKLTLDSIVNTIKELWDLTGSTSQKLTLSTASKNLIADVYVKLVDVTDEMLSQDPYAANKKPCVVCESTDEGAMTITEYAISKNWAIA